MDKFLSHIFNNKEKWIKFLFYIFDAVISILSIVFIPNKFWAILFIIGIFFINIFNIYIVDKNIIKNLKIEKILNSKIKKMFLIFLLIFAIIPLCVGVFVEKSDFIELFFGNTIPNIMGALTVFSLISHMLKFNYSNFVIKILRADYIMNSIIKTFYYFCFFNSVNFFINKNLEYTNIINNIYLFVVILSGLIVGSAFIFRIFIDDTPFDFSPRKVYPTCTLYCGAAFLIFCGLPSYFIEVEISPILLIFNTITAFIVALALLYFIIRKSNNLSSEYPFMEFGVFTIVTILNCCFYIIHNVENIGNIKYQFATGGCILIAVILALYVLNKRIKNKGDNES
ncbi:MAG: hypothetical protein NC489_37990 [Ruminococcus flavefaciens]|nr:hypothetical protein [Ruminococcus flavefaciens]